MTAWFARNTVAANLLMVFLVVGGGVSLATVKYELFPEFSLDVITVSVPYPGAAPEEVEEGVCIKIEEEVHSIEGVKEVRSTAVEGMGTVTVEVLSGADPRRVLDDVKARVDAIDTFPEDAEKPVVEEVLMRTQVINVVVHGDVPERTLKEYGERLRDEINALEGISQVELVNARPYEVSVEVSEADLRRHGLTFDEVAEAVRASSVDLTGGTIETERGDVVLRSRSQAYRGEDFGSLVLLTRPDGSRVLLGDVATVVDGFAETDRWARFDGSRSVMVQVFRVGDESALAIAESVHAYVEEARARLPAGVSVDTWQDAAVWLESRLNLLVKNGLQGLGLVFLVLALFLRFRLSFWVTLGIPLSFLGALMVMPGTGQSINMLSLFAFILVLGIVVDDAIVVGENVHEEHERGAPGVEGAVRGVQGVAVPVVFAVLTTIVAFFPMLFLPGVMGKFFSVIPMAVIPALAFSLIESQLVLPAHLSHLGRPGTSRLGRVWPFRGWVLLQGSFAGGLKWFVRRVYRPSLALALRQRYLTVATAIATMLLTVGAVGGGYVKYVFFPAIEGDILAAQITMPQGTSASVTAEAVARLEEAAQELAREVEGDGGEVVRHFMASVGEQPYLEQQTRAEAGGGAGRVGSHYGEVVVELVPAEERDLSSTWLLDRWRELSGAVPGAVELEFGADVMSAGDPVDVQLAGPDVDVLESAADELATELRRYPGVLDVTDSFRGGKQELVVEVLPTAEALGVSQRGLARQVRQGFYGEEAQRIQRGRDDVKVMVRYPERTRRSLHGVEAMRVRTPGGLEAPFGEVARLEPRRGYATIQRSDRARTVHVTADVDLGVTTPNDVLAAVDADVLPPILERHRGVRASFEGQSTEQRDIADAMGRFYVVAFFVMYALMAVVFRSYVQPLIVMSAIPFGVVGAVWGHALLGVDLSMLSVLGIAALGGVVVNDSLVLVDFVNRERAAGRDVLDAARAAGTRRFRPILLTSLTTFVGLTPLILEESVQAQFLVPMAVSLAFGVIFSTVISLVLVPCGYLILDDLGRALRWLYGGAGTRAAAPESPRASGGTAS